MKPKKVCVPIMGLSFVALRSHKEKLFGFGWVGGLAWGSGPARSPPPPLCISTSLVLVCKDCAPAPASVIRGALARGAAGSNPDRPPPSGSP